MCSAESLHIQFQCLEPSILCNELTRDLAISHTRYAVVDGQAYKVR